ncbi:related to human BCS1 protein [Fusarium fujikuroi]|nr:related to human BCS1 protein [Fusarium fujikuroi]
MCVAGNDPIYSTLMTFLAKQPDIGANRHLAAQTVFKSAWDEEEDSAEALTTARVEDDRGSPQYLNFASDAARFKLRYVPAMGTTGFRHAGTYFRVSRKKDTLQSTNGRGVNNDVEELTMSCFGRSPGKLQVFNPSYHPSHMSTEPIKQLLQAAKIADFIDTRHKTTIYRPGIKENRANPGSMWQLVTRRPIRPMETVILEHNEKNDVLKDINEYLRPETAKWYASRGIPLRRGYLFHGPPGAGKTSFSFAIAGLFGLDIHVISLQDPTITEEDLAAFFTKLPHRCVVLLEDIDTAGLRRSSDDDDEETDRASGEKNSKVKTTDKMKEEERTLNPKKVKDSPSDTDSSGEEKTRHKRHKRRNINRGNTHTREINNGSSVESISLSGLLNTIDGVASHEGRILIMTTNKPESLDEALVRPGRIDVQVGFKNATSAQATELFRRMYERPSDSMSKARPVVPKVPNGSIHSLVDTRDKETVLSIGKLKEISENFGRLIPEGMFSPADIQGFLLKRKDSPQKALEDAGAWTEAAVEQRKLKSKVVTVQ